MRLFAAAAFVVAIVGCSRPAPRFPYAAHVDAVIATHIADGTGKQVAAPTTLEPRPWKVGQWSIVLYRPKGASNERATYRATRVIAEDSCGLWIQIVEGSYAWRSRSTMCLRASTERARSAQAILDRLQVVIEQEDEQRPHVVDFRKGGRREERKPDYERLARTLVVPPFVEASEIPRETVDVPAGRVMDAFRSSPVPSSGPSSVSWFHPDVPFGALVKSTSSDGSESVLLGFGDTDPGDSTVLAHFAESPSSSQPTAYGMNFFVGWATGLTQFTETANQVSDGATSFSWRFGNPVATTVDLISNIGLIMGARYAPDPSQEQLTFFALLGVRWIPFRVDQLRPRTGPLASRLSFDGSLGYAELVRDETAARGLAVGLAVDFVIARGPGWEVALELGDRLDIYNSGQGLQHSLTLNAVAQLYVWR